MLLHLTPTYADTGAWSPSPICSNLHWCCFSFRHLAQSLHLHLRYVIYEQFTLVVIFLVAQVHIYIIYTNTVGWCGAASTELCSWDHRRPVSKDTQEPIYDRKWCSLQGSEAYTYSPFYEKHYTTTPVHHTLADQSHCSLRDPGMSLYSMSLHDHIRHVVQ